MSVPRPDEGDDIHLSLGQGVLYRGSTVGWPGNEVLRLRKITCTTTDPLVAVLFAVECRNHGAAVVLMAARGPFVTLEIEENWLSVIESAVNLRMTPEEFASRAVSVDLERAVEALREMGFRVPERIALKADLQDELEESHRQGQRLSEAQIEEFHRRVWGAE